MNFDYKNGFKIQDLSLKIEENSIYALTGNNGSGKTTLLRLLVGLLKPKSGTIRIFNEVLTRNKKQLWKVRQKIGFLFQNPDDQLFAPTIEEDVGFGARNLKLDQDEVRDRVEWALKAVNLFDYKRYSPFNLSWGQKKRACLAGLLVMKPKLLILDEPFANLDFKSIYSHLEIFEKLRKEEMMTILFTSHNLFFVENWAEKMLVINGGKTIFEGEPKKGLNHPEVKKIMDSYDQIRKLIQKNQGKNLEELISLPM
ncbi:MAG: energy-coupling factor ABC transporter ATP-binding protein [Candidatus Hodarchaeota archaeon]